MPASAIRCIRSATRVEWYEMILNVLASGEMAFAARKLVGNPGQLLHLRGRQQPAGDLASDHLHTRLALPVDAVLQSKGTEFILGDFAGKKRPGALAEGFNFSANHLIVLDFEILARARRNQVGRNQGG